jgi:ribonuclease HI
MICGKTRKEISGGVPATTNNRMEMSAALEALKRLRVSCEVVLWTDSIYLRDGITKWIRGWKARGWRTSTNETVKNAALWKELDAESTKHRITWQWIKGHAGHKENERCDVLAVTATQKMRGKYTPAQLKEFLHAFKSASGTSAPGAGEPSLF